MKHALHFVVGSLLSACAGTGQADLAVPLFLAGTDTSDPVLAAHGDTVAFERAELAFGPLYLCAGFTAGTLCDTARLEWLDSRVVDLTSATPEPAGQLVGVSGPVRSWMYDLGISAQLTRSEPFVLEAAEKLGGVSLALSGHANVLGTIVPFRTDISIKQEEETEIGVPVVRKSTSDAFAHDVKPSEPGLLIHFDVAPWFREVDFRVHLQDSSCTEGGPDRVCAGQVEQTCAPDGSVLSTRDCAALEQVCLADTGCAEELELTPETQAFRSLRNAVISGSRPTFSWGFSHDRSASVANRRIAP